MAERPRARLRSVRARTTLGAAITVAIALTLGALIASALHVRSLAAGVDSALEVRADDLVALLTGAGPAAIGELGRGDETLVQVLDRNGRVLIASRNVAGGPALVTADGATRSGFQTLKGAPPLDDDTFRILVRPVSGGPEPYTLIVASSLDPSREAATFVRVILLIGVPIMTAIVGGVTWVSVGRALAPIEAIRRSVATIEGAELGRRLPEPAVDDEVGRLARTMNAMLARLEAFSRREREFVADASHELRSPLANMRAQLEVDLAHPETAQPQESARSLLEETERLERLVDDLLELARSDGAAPAPRVAVDLDDVVFSEIGRLRLPQGITVDASAVSGAQLQGDGERLTRVVRNLLVNAVRHARARVVLTLAEDARGQTLTFTVADDGPGVPEAERERIFERFTRLDAARARDAGGTGLGLAIARAIVEAHHGEIRVEAAPGGGARFVVRLPIDGSADVQGGPIE